MNRQMSYEYRCNSYMNKQRVTGNYLFTVQSFRSIIIISFIKVLLRFGLLYLLEIDIVFVNEKIVL